MRDLRPLSSLVVAVAGALVLSGCRENPVSVYEAPPEDLSLRRPGPLASMRSTNAAVAPAAPRLEWTKPAAWTEKPASEMRLASYAFRAADGAEADVAVLSFPDAAGGILANINRWRGQVALPAVATPEESAERTTIAGQVAWMVDLAGTPTSGVGGPAMGATAAPSGPTRILGAIIPVSGQAWFFKMMGPDGVVESQRATFAEFVASIRAVTPASTPVADVADPHAGVPGAPPLTSASGTDMDPNAVPPPPRQDGFTFEAPPGWEPQRTSQFRLASFSVPGTDGVPAADVSVSAFPGMAGQDLANVNRWRAQVGLGPIRAAELPGITTVVEGQGLTYQLFDFESPTAMGDSGHKTRLLAAMLKQGDTIWFFKMTGESAHVAGQRDAFVQFLRSFRLGATP